MSSDCVSLHALTLTANIGPDCWDRIRPQPVLLTLHLHTSLTRAGDSDDVSHSVDYAHLSTAILALQAPQNTFPNLIGFSQVVADLALNPQLGPVDKVHIIAEAPKLLLQAQGLGVEMVRRNRDTENHHPPDKVYFKDLTLPVIIGIRPHERIHKQLVVINVTFLNPHATSPFPHRDIADRLIQHIEATSYLTLEAFATSIARIACFLDGMDTVTVSAQKPSAVSFGYSSGVEITRNRTFFT